MIPLKIAVLWHQHQPWYKVGDEFVLPWVRLHGVKDYLDLAELLNEFPDIRQAFNLVPSLMMQVQEYVSGKTADRIQRLSSLNSEVLTNEQKREILSSFFLCNTENMINPYPRFRELAEKASYQKMALQNYSSQDWLDLQVWYNLSWIGQISRGRSSVKRLFHKERNFTENEKNILLNQHLEILSGIVPALDNLRRLQQVEISCSPMYHPILPLLCNSESALEASPDNPMPDSVFSYPEDAESQVRNAVSYYYSLFGCKPEGMWPSEGSVSDYSLGIMSDSGIRWAASDEKVLENTIKKEYKPLDKYFPWKYKNGDKEITLFFRDHALSDAIGFTYSGWHHFDAVNDFMHRLRHIRSEIINSFGEGGLENAVVPVILDGENCWEFYKDNGWNFLRELYLQLSKSEELKTVTFTETLKHGRFLKPELNHITAGSWINGNFDIWIGHKHDIEAWNMLSAARKAVDENKDNLSPETLQKVMDEVYIAEGSDWCWWYGDEHNAPNKADFDVMYRSHIAEIYNHLEIEHPENIKHPIGTSEEKPYLKHAKGLINPVIDGKITSEDEWNNAGFVDVSGSMSAMHQVGGILQKIWFGTSENNIFFRLDLLRQLTEADSVHLLLKTEPAFQVVLKKNGAEFIAEQPVKINNISYSYSEIIELMFSRELFGYQPEFLKFSVITKSKDGEIRYPRQNQIEVKL